MAQTNAFHIDKWTGGISDDVFVGIENSSYDIQNLEIRKNPKSIKLQRTLVNEFESLTPTGYFHCGVAVSNGKILMFTTTGEVRINISGTRTLAYTHASNPPILGAIEYNGYVRWCTADKLHRVLLATLAATFTPTDIAWATFTEANTVNHPMLVWEGDMYIGDGKNVAGVQETVFDAAIMALPADETVYQLTDNGASVRVYTRQGSNDNGMLHFWDGVSSFPEQTQRLTGKIQLVAVKDAVDYAILGVDPVLYFYPYQRQALKRIPAYNLSPYPNAMIVYENYLLIGRQGGAYTWGAYIKDYPECLNYDYISVSNDAAYATCIINSGGTLYIAFYDAENPGPWIERLSTTDYVNQGSFITRAFYGQEIRHEKFSVEAVVTHLPLLSGESIDFQLYTNLDLDGVSQDYTITGPTTDYVTKFKINANFYMANMRSTLRQSEDPTHTPEIYDIYLKLEESQ